jgi:DNA-binding NtrC family response regulator
MAHILVIEDDDSYREMLRTSLEERGHTITEARDGQEGLSCFSGDTFDVVITDIIMPKKDGVETIIALRRLNAATRIIAISGGGHLVSALNCIQIAKGLGVYQALEKPFSMDTLAACIEAKST